MMLKVFFSYSHRDEELRNELEVHLSMLKRQGIIDTWHDRRITAGKDIHGQISEHLESADIILLLVSPYFLASDYCYDVEMTRALERHQTGAARVIPVIAQPCAWQAAPFGSLRATPPDGKPVSKFPNIHDAFLAVTNDIRAAALEIQKPSPDSSRPISPARPVTPAARVLEPRSSNLRIKVPFTDRQRDQFLEDSFQFIANFFENSLAELQTRYPEVETSFTRIDAHRFTAAIYVNGVKQASCRIWRGGSTVGDIAYSTGDLGPSNSFNEALSVVDDGLSLLLRPLGLRLVGNDRQQSLSMQGGAEYLWSILVDRLQ